MSKDSQTPARLAAFPVDCEVVLGLAVEVDGFVTFDSVTFSLGYNPITSPPWPSPNPAKILE